MNSKVSSSMLRAMENLMAGRSVYYGISGKSAHGGMSGTIWALHRRGWLTLQGALSVSGREALSKAKGESLDDIARRLPIGRIVRFYPIADEPFSELTAIRSGPWRLGHGDVVIKVNGRAGGVLVSHLELIP